MTDKILLMISGVFCVALFVGLMMLMIVTINSDKMYSNVAHKLIYVKDSRTNLCYAFSNSERGFTNVPCDKVNGIIQKPKQVEEYNK